VISRTDAEADGASAAEVRPFATKATNPASNSRFMISFLPRDGERHTARARRQ
jgi:hypothetical protein